MAAERIVYATALALCGMLYLVWGEWLLWVLLAALLGLPFVSVTLSLPAIYAFQTAPSGPKHITQGEEGTLALMGRCSRPVPPFRGALALRHSFTGKRSRYRGDRGIPTDHCGSLHITVEKARVCDYLGLLSFPVRNPGTASVIIRPRPIPSQGAPASPTAGQLRTGEEELRPYRPGDSLKGIHWKISARIDTLTFRERSFRQGPGPGIRVTLSGTPETLDRKLGQLLSRGEAYLKEGTPFFLEAITGEGRLVFRIRSRESLYRALDRLLCSAPEKGEMDG